jgi:hypothetical protein
MDKSANDLMQLFLRWYYGNDIGAMEVADFDTRKLICTPFGGPGTAGWVVCVNGTPPRGTLVILGMGPPFTMTTRVDSFFKRVFSNKQQQIIEDFVRIHLKDQNRIIELCCECRPS